MRYLRFKNKFSNFTVVRILKIWMIPIRLLLAFINISKKLVDSVICKVIDHLIDVGLYEPRLTMLINSLECK